MASMVALAIQNTCMRKWRGVYFILEGLID